MKAHSEDRPSTDRQISRFSYFAYPCTSRHANPLNLLFNHNCSESQVKKRSRLWKALRNLILSPSWPCFEQKFGLEELLRSLLTWIIPHESHIKGWLCLWVINVELHVPPQDPKVEKLFSQTDQLVTLGWSCVNTGLLFALLSGLLLYQRESKLPEEGYIAFLQTNSNQWIEGILQFRDRYTNLLQCMNLTVDAKSYIDDGMK